MNITYKESVLNDVLRTMSTFELLVILSDNNIVPKLSSLILNTIEKNTCLHIARVIIHI